MATSATTATACGCSPSAATGTVRLIGPGGGCEICTLCAMRLVALAEDGASQLALVTDAGHDWVCPGCARLRAPGTSCVCGGVAR